MPYFQMESSTSLQPQQYIPIAFVRNALTYQQVGAQKAVMELPSSMDPSRTLANYRQKISVKKSVLAPREVHLDRTHFR